METFRETHDKLLGLLCLTTSDNDDEALRAIRAVNRTLAEIDVTWEDVMTPEVVEVHKPAPVPPKKVPQTNVEHMLQVVQSRLKADSKSKSFIHSIAAQYRERGSLTDRQLKALKKFYAWKK